MKSLVLLGASALFLLSACGGDSESTSGPAKSTSADMEVSTYDGLPSCAEKREGKTAYVKDQEQGYICQNGKWVEDDDAVKVYPSSTSVSIVKPSVTKGSFTDSRDGKKYRTVTIGSQTWMAENLNYQSDGSYCYDDKPANCTKYGRLYEYDAAEKNCPAGWHLPSKDEWWTLFELANKTYPDSATYSLWATGFKNWPQAFDAFGFSVVPAGIRKSKEDVDRGLGYYRNLDEIAFFQVREPSCVDFCKLVCISDSCEGTFLANNANVAGLALSVRCLKDEKNVTEEILSSSSSSSRAEYSSLSNTLKDSRDGKIYKTVQIGSQTWMAENLNYADSITAVGLKDRSWCFGNKQDSCEKYGRLYTWAAAMDSAGNFSTEAVSHNKIRYRGICPEGWHIPTETEWMALIIYVDGVISKYTPSNTAGTKLKATSGWNGYNGSDNGSDAFGFAALPAGIRKTHGDFDGNGYDASFWSSEKERCIELYYKGSDGKRAAKVSMCDIGLGLSVRCLKDERYLENNGFVYSTITDARDSQVYKTVKIGSQIWMAQNLNYADFMTAPGLKGRSWCHDGNGLDNCEEYGRIYTWAAAIDSSGDFSTVAKGCGYGNECSITTSVRGICPEGWHIPSNDEWNILFTAVGGDSTAGMMLKAASFDWKEYENKIGNGLDAFGFAALPAGGRSSGDFYVGSDAYFWSATEYNSRRAYRIGLSYSYERALLGGDDKSYGSTVRCLKD